MAEVKSGTTEQNSPARPVSCVRPLLCCTTSRIVPGLTKTSDIGYIHATPMRKIELFATGLLILMAIVFCICLCFEHAVPWLRILRAFAEASMVGALADWFAVVVLFRHPLGIPIPHTAIIPKSKDRIGAILGNFVVRNFLTEDVIKKHFLSKINMADALSELLVKNADIIATETVSTLPKLLEYVKDDDIHFLVRARILPHFRQAALAGTAGGMFEFLTHGESFENLTDEGLRVGRRILHRSVPVMRRYILTELPSIWPSWFGKKEVARRIAKHVIGRLEERIAAIESDPNHATRKAIHRQVNAFIDKLNTSPEYQQTSMHIVEKIITNPVFSEYIVSLWKELKQLLEAKAQEPDKALKHRIETMCTGVGASIKNDVQLHGKLNETIEELLLSGLPHFAPDIQQMIEKTVGGWSEKQIAETLEPAVGRDLQFIRINGTVIGGLAGLAIFFFSQLFPH